MRIRDALYLSRGNAKVYRKRNLMIMLVMGVIFGLVFAINLWLQGVQNSYAGNMGRVTGGKVVIAATNQIDGAALDDDAHNVSYDDMVQDIEVYGGRVLGRAETYGMFRAFVLPRELVERAIEVDIDTAPEDAAPVLASVFLAEQLLGKNSAATRYATAAMKQSDYEEMRRALIGETFVDKSGAKYYVVGMNAGSFHTDSLSFQALEQGNNSLLNPLLKLISTEEAVPIVIDNGKSTAWQVGVQPDTYLADAGDTVLAVFDDYEKVNVYFKEGGGLFPNSGFSDRVYGVSIIAGLSPETGYVFNAINVAAIVLSIALIGAAIVVVVFTSIRLVDQDRQNIALYYSLGADERQVKLLYLCYFLRLMVGALVFAFGLASLVVMLFSAVNQGLISTQAELVASLPGTPSVIWYGVNLQTFGVMAIMLLMAVICVLVNKKRLGSI